MSKFQELLKSEKFLVTVEASPPKGGNIEDFFQVLDVLKGKIDAIVLPDAKGAKIHISPVAASILAKDRGLEPIITLSCRDRNRISLNSELMGANALGLKNILCVSGDYVTFGDAPQAKPVYDLDSVQAIQMIRNCERGNDIGGNPVQGEMSFCVGCAANPVADPLEPQLIKVEKKLAAGIDFIQTLEVYEFDHALGFFEHVKEKDVNVLAGVRLITKKDVELCNNGKLPGNPIPEGFRSQIMETASEDEALKKAKDWLVDIIGKVKQSGLCRGIHITAEGNETLIPEILTEAGIQ